MGPAVVAGARGPGPRRRRLHRRPPDGRAARAPRRRLRRARAPTASRSTSRRRRTPTTRSPRSATPAAGPAWRSTRARRCEAVASCVERPRPGPLHDRQPRLGRPGVPPRLARARSSGCGRSLGDGPALEVDGGIDARDGRPVRARGRDACSSQDPPCSARTTRRLASARSRRAIDGLSVASRMGGASACVHNRFRRHGPPILIVDDHPSFRASARVVLESDGFERRGRGGRRRVGAHGVLPAAARGRPARRPAARHRRLRRLRADHAPRRSTRP